MNSPTLRINDSQEKLNFQTKLNFLSSKICSTPIISSNLQKLYIEKISKDEATSNSKLRLRPIQNTTKITSDLNTKMNEGRALTEEGVLYKTSQNFYKKKVEENREYKYLEGIKDKNEGRIRKGERTLSLSQRKKHIHEVETKRAEISDENSYFPSEKKILNKERLNALKLQEWVQQQKEAIESNFIHKIKKKLKETLIPSSYLQKMQNIYSIALGEIINYVSRDCKERGEILESIWNHHSNIALLQVRKLEKNLTKNETDYTKELNQIKNCLNENQEKYVKETNILNGIINSRDIDLKKIQSENHHLRKIDEKWKHFMEIVLKSIIVIKDQLDSSLQENLRNRLQSKDEMGVQPDEIFSLRRQYEQIKQSNVKEKEKIMNLLDKFIKSDVLEGPDSNHSEILDILKITLHSNRIDGIDLEDEKKNKNKNNQSEMENELFIKEIGIDTSDLRSFKTQRTSTVDLASLSPEKSVQTVIFEEIEIENEDLINQLPFSTFPNLQEEKEKEVEIEQIEKKAEIVRKEIFFNFQASKKKKEDEFSRITLRSICQPFQADMNSLLEELKGLILSYKGCDLYNTFPNEWRRVDDMVLKYLPYVDPFFKNLINRDVAISNELIQFKIDLYEAKLIIEEASRINNSLTLNFNHIKGKFHEFFTAAMKINKDEETLEVKDEDGVKKDEDPIIEEGVEEKEYDKQRKKGETSIDMIQNVSESKIEETSNNANILSKNRISIALLAALPEKVERDKNKKKPSMINTLNKARQTRKTINVFARGVANEGGEKKDDLRTGKIEEPTSGRKEDQSSSPNLNNKLVNENLISLINEANTYLSNKKKPARLSLPHFQEAYVFKLRLAATGLTSQRSLPHVSLLKSIGQLYAELSRKSDQSKEIPLFYSSYEFFLNKLGNRERTENYILKAIETCLSQPNIPRLNNFAKLMGMLEGQKNLQSQNFIWYDGRDLNNYFDLLQKLDDNPIGGKESRFLGAKEVVGLNRAQDIVIRWCGALGNVEKKKVEKILNEIKEAKMDDPIVTRKFVVDVDFVADRIFWIYDIIYDGYFLPFSAVDIDGSEALSINEFLLLMRNIERGSKINHFELVEIFNREYDQVDEEKNENCFGFRRFAAVCLKYGLCSIAKQEKFMGAVTDEIKDFKILKDEFEVKKNLIKLKLIKSGKHNEFYYTVIKLIEAGLKDQQLGEDGRRMVWMQYRIIDEEANYFLINSECEDCLPEELNLIGDVLLNN